MLRTSAVGLMDPHNVEKLSELTVKELRTRLAGVLSIPSALKSNKSALLEYVAKYAPTEQLEFLLQLAEDKLTERDKKREVAEVERKRKRSEQQISRRAVRRLEDIPPDSTCPEAHFLQLPTGAQVKDCYQAFYNATANSAVASAVCGICGRLLDVVPNRLTLYPINSLPNVHRLVPNTPHPHHILFEGKLLDMKGVQGEGGDAIVMSCKECFDDLKGRVDSPPKYSLANNMYPRVYVFKLYPKKISGVRDASMLQRGMRM